MLYEEISKSFDGVKKTVISLSGGLDSTTLLHLAVRKLGRENVYALSFNYNQRHSVELECAKNNCKTLGVAHKIIDISFLGDIVSGVSAMVKGKVPTPTARDLEAGKTVPTYVPFRNSILSSITLAFAESVGADSVALGVQYGDYENSDTYYYWDTSPQFHKAVQALADLNDKHKIRFVAPFISSTKREEIQLGVELGIDYGYTWTCYNPISTSGKIEYVREPAGGKNPMQMEFLAPCGVCPSCVGRQSAFKDLNLVDPQTGMWIEKGY